MNGAALLVGYCIGMVVTRRTAPLAGAGILTLILPLTLWAPLATPIVGVAACRLLGGWLSVPPALASLPVLRETTRQAAMTTHAVPGTATRPRATARDTTAPARCARPGLVARDGAPDVLGTRRPVAASAFRVRLCAHSPAGSMSSASR
jgi:hypothetical protein